MGPVAKFVSLEYINEPAFEVFPTGSSLRKLHARAMTLQQGVLISGLRSNCIMLAWNGGRLLSWNWDRRTSTGDDKLSVGNAAGENIFETWAADILEFFLSNQLFEDAISNSCLCPTLVPIVFDL